MFGITNKRALLSLKPSLNKRALRHDLHLSPCRMLHVLAHLHVLTHSLSHTLTRSTVKRVTRYALRVRAAVWVASKKRMKPGFRRDEQFGTRSASHRECILPQEARADRRSSHVGLHSRRPISMRARRPTQQLLGHALVSVPYWDWDECKGTCEREQ